SIPHPVARRVRPADSTVECFGPCPDPRLSPPLRGRRRDRGPAEEGLDAKHPSAAPRRGGRTVPSPPASALPPGGDLEAPVPAAVRPLPGIRVVRLQDQEPEQVRTCGDPGG